MPLPAETVAQKPRACGPLGSLEGRAGRPRRHVGVHGLPQPQPLDRDRQAPRLAGSHVGEALPPLHPRRRPRDPDRCPCDPQSAPSGRRRRRGIARRRRGLPIGAIREHLVEEDPHVGDRVELAEVCRGAREPLDRSGTWFASIAGRRPGPCPTIPQPSTAHAARETRRCISSSTPATRRSRGGGRRTSSAATAISSREPDRSG